ncbi:MAG TPA: 6-bladed beta-propeller [Bacteroidales bacterium]|nr:6-bladed beta-propeller [Bacteroidales bacterium]
MKFLCSLTLLLFLSLSCKHLPNTDEEKYPVEIKVNVSQLNHDSLNLSEIADEIEYIPLETSDSALLQDIIVVTSVNNSFFLEQAKYRFDNNGNFINRVYQLGHGPKECLPKNFAVNKADSCIYIYGYDETIKVYSNSGSLRRTINCPFEKSGSKPRYSLSFFNNYLFIPSQQFPQVKNIYSCYNLNNDSLIVLCKNYRSYNKNQMDRYPSIILMDDLYQVTDSTLLYKENFSDTIFSVDKQFKQQAKYKINLGNEKLEWEAWRDTRMFIVSDNPPTGYLVQAFFETKTFLIFEITSLTDTGILVVYNKENNSTKLYPCNGERNIHTQRMMVVYLRNDLDGILPIPFKRVFNCSEGYFYAAINAMDFQKAWSSASEQTKTSSEYLRKMHPVLSQINENSNPVILKIHMR